MFKQNQRLLKVLNVLSDALLLGAAYLLAVWVRFDLLPNIQSAQNFLRHAAYNRVAVLYVLGMVVLYSFLHLYRWNRTLQIAQEVATVCLANACGALGFMAALFLFRLPDFSRNALVLLYLFSTVLVAGKRVTLRVLGRFYRQKGYNRKFVVVVGNGHLARQYIQSTKKDTRLGLHPIGYVSRRARPELGTQLGAYEDLERILEARAPDEVVIALEPHEVQMMPTILSACEKQGVRTCIIPYYNDYLPAHPQIEIVGDCKLMNIRTIPLDDLVNATLKRTADVVGSLLLIVLTSPIMLAVAIGVKLSSPGPVLFRQTRVGLNKKEFQMLKFRSMRADADHEGWTTSDDPRKTRFGSFIRKFSLDELPQFFNVLRGDMSLVGPRPELPHFVEQFKEDVPLYLVRQLVRPGITGWAQVHGLRGDTSIVERVKYDIWYIENWTWLLDIKILFMTVFGGMVNPQEKVLPTDSPAEEKADANTPS